MADRADDRGPRLTASMLGSYSRRAVLRAGALGAAALAAGAAVEGVGPRTAEADVTQEQPLAQGSYSLNQQWRFGGVYVTGSEDPGYSEAGFATVALPHTVTALSWGGWNPAAWEQLWIYRKHIAQSAVSGGRVFVDFQGVMTSAVIYLNGTELAAHQGGYLPFSVELTEHLVAGDNVLAVQVDAALQDVPPNNVAGGDAAIDYLQPGGIYRDAALRIVPEVYVSDVFAKPTDVLTAPGLDVQVTLDPAISDPAAVVTATLLDGARQLASASAQVAVGAGQTAQQTVSLNDLSGISLWSPESPSLYEVQVQVSAQGAAHTYAVTTGFREAVFAQDGFYLNGARYELFGVNRHQLFPYTGMAAPARLQRRDAELIKDELQCNMVRCSHYPQSDWFLDACDELGLLVWEEPPGWQYVGDAAFRSLVLQNVQDMVVRDRSRPSVIVWATRLNETSSQNNEALYAQTDQIAQAYDGTRQTTGAMNEYSLTDWNQQVFAYDDYHSVNNANQAATLLAPLPGVPYMVSEAVGALDGAPLYRWVDPQATLALQATMHAQVHDIAQGDAAYAGLLGWCAIDYASLNGGDRIWNDVKWPGVTDTFRVPKPAAGFYASQGAPAAAPVIAPGFFWDFGAASPATGPGSQALIATNCDQLRFYVNGSLIGTAGPDAAAFPNLAHPPVFVDFPAISGSGDPLLRIDGYVGGQLVTSLTMSSDTSQDRLQLVLDDDSIVADGSDATRFTIRAVDAHGNHRPQPGSTAEVTLTLSGPGTLIADNPFAFGAYGGVGGGFIRSQDGQAGTVTLTATHPTLGTETVSLSTIAGSPSAGAAGSGGPRVLNPLPAPAPVVAPAAVPAPARVAARSRLADDTVRRDLRRILTPRGPGARIPRLLRDGYTTTFQAPSAGHLVIGWYHVTVVHDHGGRRTTRRVLVASASVHVKGRGRARAHIRLTQRGRTLLRHARHERLTAEAAFTPRGQRRVSVSRIIELKR